MKKAIVFNNSAFVFPQTEAMFEDAEELKQAGYDVLVVRCGRSLEACFCNPEGYSAICLYCEACHKNMYRLLSKGFGFERIRRMPAKSSKFNIRTMQDIKAIVYPRRQLCSRICCLRSERNRRHLPDHPVLHHGRMG